MANIFRKVKKILYDIIFIYFYLKYFFLVYFRKRIVIFDIDNTIADTWPSFLEKYKNERERLNNLKPFKNIVKLVLNYSEAGNEVIFLSARDYKFYKLTKKWITNNCIKNFQLILVSNPYEKLILLKIFKDKDIIFYDDLSHSHEKGFILFYDDVFNEIKKLKKIKHVGYKELLNLQKGT